MNGNLLALTERSARTALAFAVFFGVMSSLAGAQLPSPDSDSDRVGATPAEFRVDESGAATYSIPLYAAPGTAGMTPELALAYSSQGGDGPLGKGWSLAGLSSIARCRRSMEVDGDANAGPVSLNASDALCLDGERLVQIAQTAANACRAVANHSVTQYRTELDSFRRVCAYSSGAQLRVLSVEGRDGSVGFYGDRDGWIGSANRADASLDTPAMPGVAMSWALNRVQDTAGNYVDYVYQKGPSTSLGNGEQVLSQVRYTGRTASPGGGGVGTSAPYAELRFEYEATPAGTAVRYSAGLLFQETRELRRVRSFANGNELRHYSLSYATSTSGSGLRRLSQVQECRDATLSVCLPATTLTWSGASHSLATAVAFEPGTNGGFKDLVSYRIGDVDGDGRLDVAWFQHVGGTCRKRLWVAFGDLNGSGDIAFVNVQTNICAALGVEVVDARWHLFDYNGDGRDDLFFDDGLSASTTWKLHPSAGRPISGNVVFNTAQQLSTQVPVNRQSGAVQPILADLNGDGLLDVVYANGSLVKARLMSRSSAATPWAWGSELSVDWSPTTFDCSLASDSCRVVPSLSRRGGAVALNDFNADARSDLVFNVVQSFQETGTPGCPAPQRVEPDPAAMTLGRAPSSNQERDRRFAAMRTVDESWQRQVSTTGVPGNCRIVNSFAVALTVQSISATNITLADYRGWHMSESRDGLLTTFIKDIRFADLNGDGLSDVLLKFANDAWQLAYNDSRNFVGARNLGAIANDTFLQVVDANGDGRADILVPGAGPPCQASLRQRLR